MGIRPKLFLVFFAFGFVPMLALSGVNYWNGLRAVSEQLRNDVQRDADGLAHDVDLKLRARASELNALAQMPCLQEYVREARPQPTPAVGEASKVAFNASKASTALTSKTNSTQTTQANSTPTSTGGVSLPKDVQACAATFLLGHPQSYSALACLNLSRKPLFRAEVSTRSTEGESLRFQTQDFLPNTVSVDDRVWTTAEQMPLRQSAVRETFGSVMRYTVPIFPSERSSVSPRGALVGDVKLDKLLEEAASRAVEIPPAQTNGATGRSRLILILDADGDVVFHTNGALRHQKVEGVMPAAFKAISDAMLKGQSGSQFYDEPDGNRLLIAYHPVPSSGLSIAVADDYTATLGPLRRAGWWNLLLSALVAMLIAAALTLVVRRTSRSIEHVTEGALQIAGGNLDQRIEVRSSDETHVLAESFNRMTDRLREQMAHEAETKQFESFMHLSAMLTHDLKNAIAALSLIVSNMERQFHREEFRADAMLSLTQATDKLRTLVSKLSEPVQSLSGEHQRPRPTDLIPLIRRVLDATAEPARPLHEIETQLPDTLVATVEADRMEKVIENLIINALEAMGAKSGKLRVEAGVEGADEIFFSVADTGPGMSQVFQETRLFRPFATTKRRGVGLGLYTCREVVRAHGGRIDVISERATGTCFRVVLPLDQIKRSSEIRKKSGVSKE